MGFFSRVKSAFQALRSREEKESRTSAILVSGSFGTVWPDRDYENFAKESYMKNVVSFRCIDLIAKSVASVPWQLFRRQDDENEQIDTHPIVDLMKRPNPDESWFFLMYKLTSFLVLAGNSYVERVSPLSGANRRIPQEMYVLRPDRMSINVDESTGLKTGYTYTVDGRDVKFEIDPITRESPILQLKTFHPLNDWYGMAATEPTAREIDTNNAGTEWNKHLLDNFARPGSIFLFDGNLSDEQYDRLAKDIRENKEGPKNAGKSLILEGGKDVRNFGMTPSEMDFNEGDRKTARRICFGYGVPPQLVGIPGDITYSNYREARGALWEDTIIPQLMYIKDEYNAWLFGDESDDLFLDFVLDKVPAMSYKQDKLWERAQKSDFLSMNEKRELAGFEAREEGDVVLVPANLLPLDVAVEEPAGGEEEEEDEPQTEEEMEEDDEKAILNLMELEGMTREQAEELIGLR